MEDLSLRTCKTCKEVKPATGFGKNSRLKDGLYKSCKFCVNSKNKNYRLNDPEKYNSHKRKWLNENREKRSQVVKKSLSKPEIKLKKKIYSKAYKKQKYHSDIEYKLLSNVRSRMSHIFSGRKSKRTLELLGCSVEEYKSYLESKFQDGMSWKNHKHDGWHIDHIIPLSSFDLSNEEELIKAFHYTNTQPLWAFENLSKNDKLDWTPKRDLINA
jgi:hypothetical protein